MQSRHVLIYVTIGSAIEEMDRLLGAEGARLLGDGYVVDV
jgi:hypothetical protein